jgi:uncharacterized protein YlxP (DUF503 family)
MATLAVLHLDLHVPQANSLKDKRRIVKSFKDRCRNRFNVSVAEVESHDLHRRAGLMVAMVGVDRAVVESALTKILMMARTHRDMMLIGEEMEWL